MTEEKSIEHLTVFEALEKYPNSLSKAFHLNEDKACVYFLMEEPTPINSTLDNGIQSYGMCLKFFLYSGFIVTTKLYIRKKDKIEAITFSAFKEMCIEGIIKVKYLMGNEKVKNQAIQLYLTMGFDVNTIKK